MRAARRSSAECCSLSGNSCTVRRSMTASNGPGQIVESIRSPVTYDREPPPLLDRTRIGADTTRAGYRGAFSLATGLVFSQYLPMLERSGGRLVILIALVGCAQVAVAQSPAAVTEPAVYVFASPGGTDLKAYVFTPKAQGAGGRRAGIVIFHGGGWSDGEPSWAFGRASYFAEGGRVAVAAQYPLSGG